MNDNQVNEKAGLLHDNKLSKKMMKNNVQNKSLIQTRVKQYFTLPLSQLIYRAHSVHKKHFDPLKIQASRLLSIKTGACPENCHYCPQSARYKTGLKIEKLLDIDQVIRKAKEAKSDGASRFCMGAAWREIKDGPSFDKVLTMVKEVKNLGLEVCCTLGMLSLKQAQKLKTAGLDFYNHNIDCSRNYYPKIITTRTYDDRLNTLTHVRQAGVKVCTGGIIGMGESSQDRMDFLAELASLNPHPESVTINKLIAIPGTPLEKSPSLPTLDLVRVIATARLLMPKSMIRLSAGRQGLSVADQFLCFFAGANSLFTGEKLLTSKNPVLSKDRSLFKQLDLHT